MMRILKTGPASVALAILVACGGGGGGSGTPVAGSNIPPADATVVPLVVSAATQAQIVALAASLDTLFATSVPTTGAGVSALSDSCYLSSGFTKAMNIAEFDADPTQGAAGQAYRVGSTRSNIRVVAERNISNSDGSTRKEVDTLYDIAYLDGSIDKDAVNTMVTGSTFGLCATPQSSPTERFLGNQHLVGVGVRARNERNEQYSRTTGAPLSAAATYRNSLQFNVQDPQGLATYAVVTGPGTITVSGVATPFSIKLLSTRLLKDDLLLAGRSNNYSNWKANDAFRLCRSSTNVTVPASITNCTLGNGGNTLGYSLSVPSTGASAAAISNLDSLFANIGFVAGGVYTFKIYNDDGWKQVEDGSTRTPIATYTATNVSLPYTFAQMVGTTGLADHKFVNLTNSLDTAQLASAVSAGQPAQLPQLNWTLPAMQADSRVFRATELGEFFQGAKINNPIISQATTASFWPAERYYTPTYLQGNATTVSGAVITPAPSSIVNKSYAEFSLNYTDRNGGQILSIISFN